MKSIRLNITLICCFLIPATANAQFLGGDGDGYGLDNGNAATLNQQDFYCSGGNYDGYAMDNSTGITMNDQSFYCSGGNYDGYGFFHAPSLYLGIGIWTGLSSTSWYSFSNWKHFIVPGADNDVTIPESCPNYPVITFSMKINTPVQPTCNSLAILQGASISSSSSLYINGNMNVGGSYICTVNSNNSQQINSNGVLAITSTGVVKLGAQTTGTGITDFHINNGGTLNLSGGILEVDDQLKVSSGATLNMTGGELFVHKYGMGSSFFATSPGNFYVESGALGGISGGTLKICGRVSENGYHAMNILEPTFDFSGTATLSFQHGVSATHYNCGIHAVDGVKFQNLIINKPGNTVFVLSNLDVEGSITTETNSTLEIESGHQVLVGP